LVGDDAEGEVTDQSPKTQGVDTIEAVLHTTQAGATLPAARALFFSLMVGFLALVTCLIIDPIRVYWWRAALLGMAVSMVVSWMIDEKRRGRLFDALERRLNFDMDGDGDIGGVPIPELIVTSETMSDDGYLQGRRAPCPVSLERAQKFARGVLDMGKPPTFAEWAGGGKPFSDGQFTDFREWLIQLNGATKENPDDEHSRIIINGHGRKILRDMLGISHSPTE
jgi:hypothetical protein